MGKAPVGWRARSPLNAPVRWWAFPLAGLAYSILTAVSFEPLGVWPVAMVAIWPLVWAGCFAGKRPLLKGLLTAVGVLPLWAYEQAFIWNVTAPGYPGLVVYLSLYAAAFVWLVGMARQVDWPIPMSVVAALAWTGLEWLRGDVALTGYGFYLLGHPLIEIAALAAPAAVAGAYAVSFLVSALAGSVADAAGWSGAPRKVGGAAAGVVIALWCGMSLIGLNTGQPGETFEMRVGIVQTNIPQDNKMSWSFNKRLEDFARFVELTRAAAATKPTPDVIIWPETMFPGYALNESGIEAEKQAGLFYPVDQRISADGRIASTYFAEELLKLQKELGITMLIGATTAEGLSFPAGEGGRVQPTWTARYNSAVVIRDGEISPERYDKVELTPFGEMIPYVWRWPRLQQAVLDLGARGMGFDLSSGHGEHGLLVRLGRREGESQFGSVRVATPICFEATRGALCRRLVRGDGAERASLLANMSNDGWFGAYDGGRASHMLAARWRCMENGVPMVRSVNTGISGVIDRWGRVMSDMPTPVRSGAAKNDQLSGPGAEPATVKDAPAGTPRRTQAEGIIVWGVSVARQPGVTIYQRVGELPVRGVGGAAAALFVALAIRRHTLRKFAG